MILSFYVTVHAGFSQFEFRGPVFGLRRWLRPDKPSFGLRSSRATGEDNGNGLRRSRCKIGTVTYAPVIVDYWEVFGKAKSWPVFALRLRRDKQLGSGGRHDGGRRAASLTASLFELCSAGREMSKPRCASG